MDRASSTVTVYGLRVQRFDIQIRTKAIDFRQFMIKGVSKK